VDDGCVCEGERTGKCFVSEERVENFTIIFARSVEIDVVL
jgi:hypothetical protein